MSHRLPLIYQNSGRLIYTHYALYILSRRPGTSQAWHLRNQYDTPSPGKLLWLLDWPFMFTGSRSLDDVFHQNKKFTHVIFCCFGRLSRR